MKQLSEQERIKDLNAFALNKHPGMVGVNIISCSEESLSGELKVTEPLIAGTGFLWAPVVITLADWLASVGTGFHLKEGESFTTVELKTNFLGSAREGETILGVGKPKHLGKSTHVWDIEVSNTVTNKTIALFRCTQMILR